MTLALLLGCPHRVDTPDPLVDATFAVAAADPRSIVEQAASDLNPTQRGRAIAILIGVDGGAWTTRGLFDPDPWVQRQAMTATASRLPEPGAEEALAAFAVRADSLADPYVRAEAALLLHDRGIARDGLALGWATEPDRWRRAPLALAAVRLGDQSATDTLTDALAHGDVALEPTFLVALGRSGLIGLAPAMRAGEAWIEDEIALWWAAAELGLGEPAGEAVLRRAITSGDPLAGLEALDALTGVGTNACEPLIRKAAGSNDDAVRSYAQMALAARAEGPAEHLERGARAEDPELRRLAVRFAVEAVRLDPTAARRVRVARQIVREGLVDDNDSVRVAALAAITPVGLDPSIAEGALVDELIDVRLEAAGALLAGR